MKRSILLPLLLVAAGCATRGEVNLMQQDFEDLRSRISQLERSLTGIRTETREAVEKSAVDSGKSLDAVRKGVADLQANQDTMRIDIQLLAGKLDEFGSSAKKPFDEIALVREDTTKTTTALDERLKKLEASSDQTGRKLAELTKAVETPPTADIIYKQAQDALKAGETGKARQILAKFNDLYPGHKLAPNVQYWIGESWYIDKNYEQAALEFQKVIQEYPDKEKASAAMLKQAMAFKELGDAKSARFVLKELIDKHPNAEEVNAAKELLTRLK